MGFRGQTFAVESPTAAVEAMIARLGDEPPNRRIESCLLALARGRILAEPVTADRDNPPFDHASMDGYAVRLADVVGLPSARSLDAAVHGASLPISGEARIGCEPPAMRSEPTAVRIATGAAIPSGADAIIKREDVIEHAGEGRVARAPDDGFGVVVTSITIPRITSSRIRVGDFIRRRAENARAGDPVLGAGRMLSASALGALAAVGQAAVRVYSRIRVATITSGEELVPAGATPQAFQIRDSNSPAVQSVLAAQPWIEAASMALVRDNEEQLSVVLRGAIADTDAVVISGGISMGHRDPVRRVVEALGATVVFHGVPQRPGKPMLGALVTRGDGAWVPIFCLPGNPVSAMVTCTRIVLPVLAARAGGLRWTAPPGVVLADPDGQSLDLWWHRLVRLNDRGEASLVKMQSSGDVIAAGQSDGFIEVPPRPPGSGHAAPEVYPYYAWAT